MDIASKQIQIRLTNTQNSIIGWQILRFYGKNQYCYVEAMCVPSESTAIAKDNVIAKEPKCDCRQGNTTET
jgi:hypothetical protein